MPKPARIIIDAVRALPDEAIVCREERHDFKRWHAEHRGRIMVQWYRCHRCNVKRYRELDRHTGMATPYRYDYREALGYLVKGQGRLGDAGRAAIRLASVERGMWDGLF